MMAQPLSLQIRTRLASRLAWLRTIRGRLYAAFATSAVMTVVCSSIALYTFGVVGETTTEIATRNLPATVESFRLSNDASAVIATAPRLMAAVNQTQQQSIASAVERLARGFQEH